MEKKKIFLGISALGIFAVCGVCSLAFKAPLALKASAGNYTVVFDKNTAEVDYAAKKITTHTALGNEVVAEAGGSFGPIISPTSLVCFTSYQSITIWVRQLISFSVVYDDGPGHLMADISDDGVNDDQLIFDVESGVTYDANLESYYYIIIANKSDSNIEITSITITYACA